MTAPTQHLDPDVQRLVTEHQVLVGDLVRRVLARVPSHVDRHELCAAAGEALALAAATFVRTPGRAFADHATVAINLALRDLLRSLPCVAPAPVETMEERLDLLESAIDVLPSPQRAVVLAYFLDARPLARIADDLGLTESRVTLLLSEALVLLRDALDLLLAPAPHVAVPPRRPGRSVRRVTSTRLEYVGPRRAAAGRLAHLH